MPSLKEVTSATSDEQDIAKRSQIQQEQACSHHMDLANDEKTNEGTNIYHIIVHQLLARMVFGTMTMIILQ